MQKYFMKHPTKITIYNNIKQKEIQKKQKNLK